MAWTLKLNGGAEKPLSGANSWNISSDFQISLHNKGKSSITLKTIERFDAAAGAQFNSGDKAIVKLDGVIIFQGDFDSPKHVGGGGRECIQYQLHDVWWKFEKQQFKQHRNQFIGFTDHDPNLAPLYVDVVLPECFIGESATEIWQTNGASIIEVINWINSVYNPTRHPGAGPVDGSQDVVQIGTIEPAVLVPIQRAGNTYCAEAIFTACRLQPDCVFIVDTTTTPPTLSVRTLGRWNYAASPPLFLDYDNLDEITITLTALQQQQIERQQQDMRRLSGVLIHYKKIVTIDSLVTVDWPTDKFPLTIDDYTPETSAHFVELAGASLVLLRAIVDSRSWADVLSGDNNLRTQWWLKHDKTLNADRVDQDSIIIVDGSATLWDEFDAPLSIAGNLAIYPYELYGSMPNWMEKQYKRVTLRAKVTYDHYTDDGKKVPDESKADHEVTYQMVIVDAAPGPYSALSHFDPGEFVPEGVAEAVFRAVDVLQQQGTFTITGFPVRLDITIGKKLRLIGPTHTWDNIFIQSIDIRPGQGEVEISFGPSAPIEAASLLELARATRFRWVYNLPSGRATGGVSGSSDLDQTHRIREGNTAHTAGNRSVNKTTHEKSM